MSRAAVDPSLVATYRRVMRRLWSLLHEVRPARWFQFVRVVESLTEQDFTAAPLAATPSLARPPCKVIPLRRQRRQRAECWAARGEG